MPWSGVNTEYSIHWVQHTPSTACTEYSIHRVQHSLSTAYTAYCIHCVLHTLRTAYTAYCIHLILHHPKIDCLPLLASLQVHLQTRSITASNCVSKLARSRTPSASPKSLNHGFQVHLQTCSIVASKWISKLPRSRPQSVSLSSLNRHFQAHLEAGQVRLCISYNEMMFIYPGVAEIYAACRSDHLRYSCISECISIERLR